MPVHVFQIHSLQLQESFSNLNSTICVYQDLALFLLLTGIDYTASNAVQGQRSFGGQPLHSIGQRFLNPYQQVLVALQIGSLFTSLYSHGYNL